tara:strand:+ start:299 stop:562 length:264 start_codon:yes stop_codon:yes gene_type:complete
MLKFFMRIMGYVYCFLEKFVSYPDDHTILGIPIDSDIQKMSRREICEFIESNTPSRRSDKQSSFWNLDSTTKMRFGAQLLREMDKRD